MEDLALRSNRMQRKGDTPSRRPARATVRDDFARHFISDLPACGV